MAPHPMGVAAYPYNINPTEHQKIDKKPTLKEMIEKLEEEGRDEKLLAACKQALMEKALKDGEVEALAEKANRVIESAESEQTGDDSYANSPLYMQTWLPPPQGFPEGYAGAAMTGGRAVEGNFRNNSRAFIGGIRNRIFFFTFRLQMS